MAEKKETAFEKAQRLLENLRVAKAAVEAEVQRLRADTEKLLEPRGKLPSVVLFG